MMKCVEVTELCSRALERPLRLAEQVSLGAHLMMCTGCLNYRRQMKVMRRVARAYAEGRDGAEVPDEQPAK